MKTALYVGSFDPVTLGHLDIIKKARQVFDHVYVGVGRNPRKSPMIDMNSRVSLLDAALDEMGIDGVTPFQYDGSMMAEARRLGVNAIVRGLRQVSDFNDEFSINGIVSRTLDIPIVLLICDQEYLHISSSNVKEMAALKEDIAWMVPNVVLKFLK